MTNESLPTPTMTDAWRKLTILIVDDEPGVLRQIERDTISEGFAMLKANSGKEGLQILEQHPVHVVVSDQKMGDGMRGTKFLAEARRRQPDLIGIILSAYSSSEHLLEAINEAKAFSYLTKPWNKTQLIECLTKALRLSYFSHLKGQEYQSHYLNLLERCQKSERNLEYTQDILTDTVLKLSQTEGDLNESTHALAMISEVTGQLYGSLKDRKREKKLGSLR